VPLSQFARERLGSEAELAIKMLQLPVSYAKSITKRHKPHKPSMTAAEKARDSLLRDYAPENYRAWGPKISLELGKMCEIVTKVGPDMLHV
jgi:hypothetical protein